MQHQCDHRVYSFNVDATDALAMSCVHRCQSEGTIHYTFKHPKQISVHGSSEWLCAEHVKDAEQMFDLLTYLDTSEGAEI